MEPDQPTHQDQLIGTDRTILFSDVVGSTELIARWGDARWTAVLDSHCRILEAVAGRHRGLVVKCSGDGFMVTFDEPGDGVTCALRLQLAFAVQQQLEIRVGVHHGPVVPYHGDYVGLTVHLASRYTDLCGSGEVVMSEDCYRDACALATLPILEQRLEFIKGVDLPQPVRIARPLTMGSLL